jgi:hypothetical protein
MLFLQNGCHYYAAARFAMHAQCMPVCGILFHHTVEMLLKGGPYSRSMTLADVMKSGIRPARVSYGDAYVNASRFIRELGPSAPRPRTG